MDPDVVCDDSVLAGWQERVLRAISALGWSDGRCVVRRHARGASLAVAAPCDLLFSATEINEWAACASLIARDPGRWAGLEQALVATAAASAEDAEPADESPPVIDEAAAFTRFAELCAREQRPALRALLNASASRGLPRVLDDEALTLGAGGGGRSFALSRLPTVAAVAWAELHGVPTALVTGSNGKTTTVRLIAACARAHGWTAGYNCTDGVVIDDDIAAGGDYSGPAGARAVMRDARTRSAILETARGGILRRGLAVSCADVAVVTNVSADHFGEYGIDDLAALADVKLTVAAVVPTHGLLALNADDPVLRVKGPALIQRFGRCPPLGWFAMDWDHPLLREHRRRGGSTCGVRGSRLRLSHGSLAADLGPIDDMPLSMGGIAAYNVANLAAAALAAAALGIDPTRITRAFARFGSRIQDNPGRMMRFDAGGVIVLIDYAHNPAGLRGFLTVAEHLRKGPGRLALLLGHAGNRQDADIEELARVAAGFRPDLIVVKENDTQLRGRAPGEVPRIIRAELLRQKLPESGLPTCTSEIDAVRHALAWARPGDVLAMPVHSAAARAAAVALLQDR